MHGIGTLTDHLQQTSMPAFSRLEDAIRKVREATEYEAEQIAIALDHDAPDAYASVHHAHLDLIDTVHRLMMTMELFRRSRSTSPRPSGAVPDSPLHALDAVAVPLQDPFALVDFVADTEPRDAATGLDALGTRLGR